MYHLSFWLPAKVLGRSRVALEMPVLGQNKVTRAMSQERRQVRSNEGPMLVSIDQTCL